MALQRKKSVEERLEHQKKDIEDMQKSVQEKNDQDLQRATSSKEAVQQEQAMVQLHIVLS